MKFFVRLYNYVRCVPKTLLFNFRYLPFTQAVKFPVIVCHRVKFQSLRGKVHVPKDAKTAKIKLGFGAVQVADNRYSRMVWHLAKNGEIHFGNRNKLGTGCKLDVEGELSFGDGVNFTGECSIVCKKKISFGDRCLVAWRTIIMDTDFHSILDAEGTRLNPDAEVQIGSHVWIGANSTILKGVKLGDNLVVAASANVVSSFAGDVTLGGNPAKVIGSMKGKTFVD